MHRTVSPIFVLSVMLLSGCSLQGLLSDSAKEADLAKLQRMQQTEDQRRSQNSLSEAELLLSSGAAGKARALLDTLDSRQLDAGQQAQFNLLYAQIELSIGKPEIALQRLDKITPELLDPPNLRAYRQSRIFAYSLTDQPLAAVQERIELAPLLTDPNEQKANQKALFEALNQQPTDKLESRRADTFGGWMALTLLFKQYPQGSAGFAAALRQWQKIYPRHPADIKLLRNYTVNAPGNFYPLRNIAVLLPQTGNFAQAAQAIKDGFLAAESESRGDKPKLRFYDSAAEQPAVLYRRALADGADLIIGPLEKDTLRQLAETTQLTAPVLALNEIPGISANNLYQFALSPVDEAEQAAAKARLQGYRKAAILVPNTELGKRIARSYAAAWKQDGGTVLKTVYFNPQSDDFNPAIGKLLNFDESARRYRQVAELVPELQYTPRARQDVEVIFISASPAAARILNRQLKNSQLAGVAVYATPHLYANSANPAEDEALDGITFCDIPWFFPEAYHDTIDSAALQAPWKQMGSFYLRLLAMGIDAYNLSGRLQRLDREEYQGATGNLMRLADGRIRRNLFCARFSNGIPEPLGFAAQPHPVY
ncbi:MAG: penicillin-binding protein activator [Gammaproteobacteria bacterium]